MKARPVALAAALVVTPLMWAYAVRAQSQGAVCHAPLPTSASTSPARLFAGAGKVHMQITTRSADAQAFFDQGLALLHSFWSYEADHSFDRAAQLDQDCAMAQWGIAMANINEARRNSAIKRAKELAPSVTDRERLYIAAVEARYQGERTVFQNNPSLGATEPYKKALRKLVFECPDDLEAKLFLALSLVSGYERDGTPNPGTVEGIELCRFVLTKIPDHLAAHHYLIHLLESSKRATEGEKHADAYGPLAPRVGHAVHMPGHIYVHVDRWEDAARAFEQSAEVDRAYLRDNNETSDHAAAPYSHNLHFLAMVYGYQGRFRDGMRVSKEVLEVSRRPGEEKSRAGFEGRLAMLRTLVRFEKWDEILEGKILPDAGPYEVFKPWRQYAEALAHLGKGELIRARADLESIEAETSRLREKLKDQQDVLLAFRQRQMLRALSVVPFELKGRILAREGKADDAITTLKQAIEEEISLGYSEPTLYPNPMEEVAGRIALGLERWSDAEQFFRLALERDPGSGRALLGLMLAQDAAGKRDQARESYTRFTKAWSRADSDLPEINRARREAAAHGYSNGQKY